MIYEKFNENNNGGVELSLLEGFNENKLKLFKTKILTNGRIEIANKEEINALYFNNSQYDFLKEAMKKLEGAPLGTIFENVNKYVQTKINVYDADYIIKILYINYEGKWYDSHREILVKNNIGLFNEMRLIYNMPEAGDLTLECEPAAYEKDKTNKMLRRILK